MSKRSYTYAGREGKYVWKKEYLKIYKCKRVEHNRGERNSGSGRVRSIEGRGTVEVGELGGRKRGLGGRIRWE